MRVVYWCRYHEKEIDGPRHKGCIEEIRFCVDCAEYSERYI